ncbi:flagellar biosynthesis protein FlhB [Paenibacillus sp.]|uniref:flagellar biosynthesis protein FlhB n=1 Tax=Paenibacillus sp. TaxID=58172 RepID=UPI002D67F17A|nr:flagellar biosynthesis protein FlhB [Paenibacillus sp.]HZG57874.1 flagellar biosynthesis protein FlhB [Paenibacillus sp.]
MARKLRLTLNLQLFAQEKTEPATPKKRQESRRKGQVAKSIELPGALIMLGAFGLLAMYGATMGDGIASIFTAGLTQYLLWEVTDKNVIAMFTQILRDGLFILLPVFAIGVGMALLASYAQVGVLFTGETLKLKIEKLNPIQGVKQIFSMRSFVEFLKSMLKVLILGMITFTIIWGEKATLLTMASLPLESVLQYMASLTIRLGLFSGGALFILALFDYAYQKWEHEKNLRMSKQDIKDEYKKAEGDPLIKSKIREKQRRMAMQRMMQEVPKADVVITNPTHFAVAVKYDGAEMDAPRVIAKGADYVALRIRQAASEHGVPLMENKPLARALYAQVEIGESIPQDLFQAVAEVLAFVYKAKAKLPAARRR